MISRFIAATRLGAHRGAKGSGEIWAGADDETAERRKSLYWTALMITGNAESASESLVDAAGLTETNCGGFHDWLVQWGGIATARVALNAVRSAINDTAAEYVDSTCAHRNHETLSATECENLRSMDPYLVIQQLDVLARALLVLHGCHRVPLPECASLLNLPLQSAIGAYCRAEQWYGQFRKPTRAERHHKLPFLFPLKRDPDGVVVWGSKCPAD
jgi:hypothetical protein